MAKQDGKDSSFIFDTHTFRQVFLKSNDGSQIFVRKRSGLKKQAESVSLRGTTFDYERRYEIENKFSF